MKHLIRTIMVGLLLAVITTRAGAEESRRGFYEGNLSGGGRIVFFVQANHSISAYIFNSAGQQASFVGGAINDNRAFVLTTSANQPLSGTLGDNTVTATFLGQSVSAARVSAFGPSAAIAGRYTATAESNSSTSLDLKIVIDAQNNIFFVTRQGSSVLGGFGTVTLQANPSPSPSPAAHSPIATSSGEDEPGDDHGHHSGRGRHNSEDDDQAEDHHEDEHAASFTATFSVTLVTGQIVTGHLVFSHDLLLGDFVLNGVTYSFRAPQQSSANRLANISTRGFVTTGQGQLIGGFIITGGPKLVLVRALGPSLTAHGVSPALADPVLQLFSGSTLLRQNDNWQSAANSGDITASGLAPENASEASILVRLEPGGYTTVVSGASGSTGIALVEVYEMQRD